MDGHAYDRHRSLFYSKGLTVAVPYLNITIVRSICQPCILALYRRVVFCRHCEERSDEAIQLAAVKLDCFVAALLAMTAEYDSAIQRQYTGLTNTTDNGNIEVWHCHSQTF